MELIISNRKWSGPSLRGWLVLKRTGVAFTERKVEISAVEGRVFTPAEKIAFKARQAAVSPTALMPVLHDGDLLLWDTASIAEYLHERYPHARLWPADPIARALARSAMAEIHSGFAAFRRECRTDLFLRTKIQLTDARSGNDITRLVALFNDLRGRFGDRGPFLAGAWSIADAFATPEAARLRSYGIDMADHGGAGMAQAYCDALLQTPDYLEWERLAEAGI